MFFFEEEGKDWLLTFLSEQNPKAKVLTFPLLWAHIFCTCTRYFAAWDIQPNCCELSFASRVWSASLLSSSSHLSAVELQVHFRWQNPSTNWGGEHISTSLLKCISITQDDYKATGFEESWWGGKILSYLDRMELSRCGQPVQRASFQTIIIIITTNSKYKGFLRWQMIQLISCQ